MRLHDLLTGSGSADAVPDPGIEITGEITGDADVDVRSVVIDHRDVRDGALFCCVPGAQHDGHDYAPAAVAGGAVALLVERPLDLPVARVRVPSVRFAVGPLASRIWGDPSRAMTVIGITGTNGKTTTAALVEGIAVAAGCATGLLGTVATRFGAVEEVPVHTTAEAPALQQVLARMRDAGVDLVAMEVSSHALAQHRVDGTRFGAVAFTNLGRDHLDFHGTMGAYLEAKERLLRPAFTDRAAVNLDDPVGPEVARRAAAAGLEVRTFGCSSEADLRAEDPDFGPGGTEFTLVRSGRRTRVRVCLPGAFNVANALAAAALADLAELPGDAIRAGLAAVSAVPGRMERIDGADRGPIFVDYAHTPDALDAVLVAARRFVTGPGRVIVVFGCGGDRDRAKRPEMGAVAVRRADLVFVTSDNPRPERPEDIAAEIVAGMVSRASATVELDRREAIRSAIAAWRPGDVVVVAGKGHETGQTAAGETRPFDDRAEVRAALGGDA